ncbi:YciI family protein [Actinophytocola glycyrrhizae]|uniref:YciI family protein n=1 Tax=Actinophytocola glycyrrhizae TaxID=2044873 RepID=A0ABV9SCW4_9PSEU
MILHYASQADYDAMAGKDGATGRAWTADEVAAMGEFMGRWTNELVESGEFVAAHGLAAPVLTRRVAEKDGETVVTDGPYAETAEVVVGLTIVDCVSYDRATEIAAGLAATPAPAHVQARGYVDIRPIMDGMEDITS